MVGELEDSIGYLLSVTVDATGIILLDDFNSLQQRTTYFPEGAFDLMGTRGIIVGGNQSHIRRYGALC